MWNILTLSLSLMLTRWRLRTTEYSAELGPIPYLTALVQATSTGTSLATLVARPAGEVASAGVPASSSRPVREFLGPWAVRSGGIRPGLCALLVRACLCDPPCVVTQENVTSRTGGRTKKPPCLVFAVVVVLSRCGLATIFLVATTCRVMLLYFVPRCLDSAVVLDTTIKLEYPC